MLFKLSLKNIQKSFKDYTIYFLTLALGIAIFYVFNSLDAQEAMLTVSASTKEIIKLMINMLSAISIFIAVILGFLIVYANNFLIKRRKKEFGIYMTLGMSKRKISSILVLETILIGILSLIAGLILGVFASQFMSVIVAKMFEVNMSKYEFVFSKAATIKTVIYFAVMYLAVLIFNTITISKYKLIDLLNAGKKNEKVKIKNPIVCVVVFIASVIMLVYSYYTVTVNISSLLTETFDPIIRIIAIGSIATLLFFWSLSGFILKVVSSIRKVYLKETNMFVLRQLNAKINTTVISMTIISLMLFVTICLLSSAMSLNKSFSDTIKEMTPVDANFYKNIDGSQGSSKTAKETLVNAGLNMEYFKDVIEIESYKDEGLDLSASLGDAKEEALAKFHLLDVSDKEVLIKVSEYNKVAKLYNIPEYSLNDTEYMVLCDYDNMANLRNYALRINQKITVNGKEYMPKYNECKEGFVLMSNSHVNTGIILVPDSANLTEDMKYTSYMIANYNAETVEEKEEIEKKVLSEDIANNFKEAGEDIDGMTKITIYEASVGISALVTFIALYIGIIFLIASSAILALKELSESSDNKERYSILRKVGTDEKMINKSLFMQIGMFFLMPLVIAIFHSIFGIQFALNILGTMSVNTNDLIFPIVFSATAIIIIYGGYFIATYVCSKNIIKEN